MTHTGLSRRQFLSRTGLALGASIAAPALVGCNAAAKEPAAGGDGTRSSTPVSMQLGWLMDNGQLGEAVAIAKGWFADSGLNVKIQPGGPNNDGLSLVANGESQIGQISSSPSLMLASSQGIPVKAFAVGVQEHPYAYFSKADNPVHTPKDFIGKTVGTQATGKILLRALLVANDIDPEDVKVVVVGSDASPLLTGRVDVITGWVGKGIASTLPKDHVAMRLWDSGIRLYANPYYATEITLTQDANMLARFLAASAEGWKYAKENLDEAVDLLLKQVSGLNKKDMKISSETLFKFEFTDATAKNGWGTMDKEIWQSQLDTWDSLNQFKGNKPSLDDVVSFDILEATVDKRPKIG